VVLSFEGALNRLRQLDLGGLHHAVDLFMTRSRKLGVVVQEIREQIYHGRFCRELLSDIFDRLVNKKFNQP
jgi:hypothetical protein